MEKSAPSPEYLPRSHEIELFDLWEYEHPEIHLLSREA
jgi:hypothetical protein